MSKHLCAVLMISLVALGLRIGYLAAFGGLDNRLHDSFGDQYIYLDLGRNLAAGKGFVVSGETWISHPNNPTSIFPPVYPLFLSASIFVFGDHLLPIRLFHVLFSVIIAVLAYLIGRELFGQTIGFVSGIATAFYPTFVMYVRPIMSEGIFYLLVTLLVYLSVRIAKGKFSWWHVVIWGIVAGLGILTRSEVLLLVSGLFVYLAYRRMCEQPSAAIALLPCLLSAVIVMLPYVWYNYEAHGRASFLPNARWKFWDHTWWAEMREHPEWASVSLPERRVVPDWYAKTEIERDEYLWNMAVQWVLENPETFVIQRVKKLIYSYPLIPREELDPPLGTKGEISSSSGAAYGPTSLDDVVAYFTPIEKIRGWLFRIIFILAVGGVVAGVLRHIDSFVVLLIPIFWNILHSMAFVGSERIRMQIDVFLIILMVYFVADLWLRRYLLDEHQTDGKRRVGNKQEQTVERFRGKALDRIN